LKEVLERIRWAQQKEYSSTTIQLGKKSEEEKTLPIRFVANEAFRC